MSGVGDRAREVAARLTNAQRETVLSLSEKWSKRAVHLPQALCDRSGILSQHGWQETTRLTPLGLAVRHLLTEQDKHNG